MSARQVIEQGDLAIWCVVAGAPHGQGGVWAADTGQFDGVGSRYCANWPDWVALAHRIIEVDRLRNELAQHIVTVVTATEEEGA